jgi:hypothetical protein
LAQIADDIAANLRWARYQESIKNPQSGLCLIPESFLFPQGKPSPMPDVWLMYRRMKATGQLWFSGGLADQPELLMLMFDACESGESQYIHVDLPHLLSLENPTDGPQQSTQTVWPH